jgi:hypothetical protein
MTFYDGSPVPNPEIEAAGDALQALWNGEENQRHLKETGCGASFLFQAQVALEAALLVRGRLVSQGSDRSQ